MSRAGLDDALYEDRIPARTDDRKRAVPAAHPGWGLGDPSATAHEELQQQQRRTPRTSLIVVLPDNHVVSPDRLADRLLADGAANIDVIVACAGQPVNLGALQRRVRDAQFLLAPSGTSTEDLRELAMRQAPGDIVSLLNGITLPMAPVGERESLNSR